MYLGDEFLRHPVALYEIVFLMLLWIFLSILKRKNRFPSGFIFQLFMLSYFSFRLLLDFIKPRELVFGNLGTIQLVCIAVIFYYIYTINHTLKNAG